MLAYLPQSRIGKKDKAREKRILLPSTEPVVTGSNPVGCTFKLPQVFINKRLVAFFICNINVFLRSINVAVIREVIKDFPFNVVFYGTYEIRHKIPAKSRGKK